MQWLDWSDDAFALASRTERPVLLLLIAPWCRFCRELEESVLTDPIVRELIEGHYVGIRVDKDRRPDIDARYTRGGWPTLAYLDESGELIASDTYLEADRLAARLRVVADYYSENREAIRRRLAEFAEEQGSSGAPTIETLEALSREVVPWVSETLVSTADPEFGGWGSPQKFPHPDALGFSLIRWSRTGDEGLRKLVVGTLKHMERGEIHDSLEGGFFRYATARDWSAPNYEKMLNSNAARLEIYVEAHQALGEESFRETAEGVLRFLNGTLFDEGSGAYCGSQDADSAYAHRDSLEARRLHGAPELDRTLFTNWNAEAVSALLKAGAVLPSGDCTARAKRTLEFLLTELFDERAGMYHYWDGTYHLPALLTDQAYMLRALTLAVQYTGDNSYLGPARVLAALSIENLRSETGSFYDTRFDPAAQGSLRRRNRSILDNSVMAESLVVLSHLTREEDWADAARDALVSFAGDYKRYGHYVAGYARAVSQLLRPPVNVTIVGDVEGASTRALLSAALKPFFAGRITQVIDPRRDPELLVRSGLPVQEHAGDARAYVYRGRESFADTDDPARLPALMTRIERTG